jgi:hypothetical protein
MSLVWVGVIEWTADLAPSIRAGTSEHSVRVACVRRIIEADPLVFSDHGHYVETAAEPDYAEPASVIAWLDDLWDVTAIPFVTIKCVTVEEP